MWRSAVRVAMLACALACSSRSAGPADSPASRQLDLGGRPGAPGFAAAVAAAATPKPEPCRDQPEPRTVTLPERVTLGDFWQALSAQVAVLDMSALRGTFAEFARRHGVAPETPGLFADFTRLWVAFEATRDGGWWRLRWDITDQEPSSIKIWKAWQRLPAEQSFDAPSAVAECDEITALFSVTARHLGVRGVGLFYPTWNHVIAGWAPEALAQQGSAAVVLVPTTQIFQGCGATFDDTTFTTPKHVYEYPRTDIRDSSELPTSVAHFLLGQVRAYGQASPDLLALIRAKRATLLGSSLGNCDQYRRDLAAKVEPQLTCSDAHALRHLARNELHRPAWSESDALAWLASP